MTDVRVRYEVYVMEVYAKWLYQSVDLQANEPTVMARPDAARLLISDE